MAYLINPEDQDLLDSVREFCDKEIKEQCKEYDVSGEWPAEIYAKIAELGYNGLEVPEEYGGLGLERITVAAIMEEFGKADAGIVSTLTASNLALKAVLIGGNEEQKQHCCDLLMDGKHGAFCLTEPMAGSDAANSKTTAVRVIPAVGRKEGDTLTFGGLLGYGPVIKVNRNSPEVFINRGGHIPAPLQSLKN